MRRRAASSLGASGDPAWVVAAKERPILLRRRRGDRRPAPIGVRVVDAAFGLVFDAFDLGPDGVFLRTELLLSMGDSLDLEISRHGGPCLEVHGEVVDVVTDSDPGRGGAGAGVRVAFRDLSIAELETLVSFGGSAPSDHIGR